MDVVKDQFYDQLRAIPASTFLIPYDDCNDHGGRLPVQAQVTKRYMAAAGMRGSWNMQWLMTCSFIILCNIYPKERNSHLITYMSGNTDYVISKEPVKACY